MTINNICPTNNCGLPLQEGSEFCHSCHRKEEKRLKALQGIKKESNKRKKENQQYNKENPLFASENNICAAFHLHAETGIKCNGIADTTQHLRGRIGELLNDRKWQIRLCWPHHDWVNRNGKRAKELGLELSRLKVYQDFN